jgi:spore germination cell wall hydrolase CwlJ-like protein
MNRIFSRPGAFASAGLLFVTLSGVGLSGAIAQDRIAATPIAAPAEPASNLRFVAEPVVQDHSAPSAEPSARSTAAASSLPALVAQMNGGELSPELNCLAQAVYFEARGEDLTGQLAVAQVVINRTASGRFPQDYCSVVTQRGQFSFVRGGHIPSAPATSPAWHRARAIARIAHHDLWDSGVGESLYFHASSVRPSWSRGRRRSPASTAIFSTNSLRRGGPSGPLGFPRSRSAGLTFGLRPGLV